MDIKISVIVPVYNVEQHLERGLESIRNQTLKNIEIICVDDGSTDSSFNILKKFENNDDRFIILTQENQHVGVARNNGLQIARGEYVVFWDPDDIFMADALSLMYNKIVEDEADICVSDARKVDASRNLVAYNTHYINWNRIEGKLPINITTNPKYIFNTFSIFVWNKMYKRAFLINNKLTFLPNKRASDVIFVMQTLCKADRITAVDAVTVEYQFRNTGSLTEHVKDNAEYLRKSYLTVKNYLIAEGLWDNELVRESFINKAFSAIDWEISASNTLDEAKYLIDFYRQLLIELDISEADKNALFYEKQKLELEALLKGSSEDYLYIMFLNQKNRTEKYIYKDYKNRESIVRQKNRIIELKDILKTTREENRALSKQLEEKNQSYTS